MADSLSELTMHWSCVERRLLDVVRTDHNGTPRSHHNVLVFVERDTTVEHVFSLDLDVAVRREAVGCRQHGYEENAHG